MQHRSPVEVEPWNGSASICLPQFNSHIVKISCVQTSFYPVIIRQYLKWCGLEYDYERNKNFIDRHFLNEFRFDCRWVCRFFYHHRGGPHAPVQRRDHLLLLSEAWQARRFLVTVQLWAQEEYEVRGYRIQVTLYLCTLQEEYSLLTGQWRAFNGSLWKHFLVLVYFLTIRSKYTILTTHLYTCVITIHITFFNIYFNKKHWILIYYCLLIFYV